MIPAPALPILFPVPYGLFAVRQRVKTGWLSPPDMPVGSSKHHQQVAKGLFL
jgi:hypothetical protein